MVVNVGRSDGAVTHGNDDLVKAAHDTAGGTKALHGCPAMLVDTETLQWRMSSTKSEASSERKVRPRAY